MTYKERYYFDIVDKKCKKFYFTGSNGNENNFPNEQICNSTCLKQDEEEKVSIVSIKLTNKQCLWVCNLNCPYGYQIDYKTNCYKCECIDMKLSDCGIPCWTEGTRGCLNPIRANSRPMCVCNPNFSGGYCEIYNKAYNFSVQLDKKLKLNKNLTAQIGM
jgi:hypothetical protein